MKISLGSLDQFHIVNQARCLEAHGHLSIYLCSRVRALVDHLPDHKLKSCLPLHYLLRIMQRYPRVVGGNHFYLQLCRAFDLWMDSAMPSGSDVVVALSGVGLRTLRSARARGEVTVIDCGSTHADHQHEVLQREFKLNNVSHSLFPPAYRSRVLDEMYEADYLQIPSTFVARTFLDRGYCANKILYSAYGVDSSLFPAKEMPTFEGPFKVICPSGVNLRKGARILAEAWNKLGWKDAELHWIGSPDPDTCHLFNRKPTSIIFHPFMGHAELAALYRTCEVFVLPSLEEGLARVMLEGASSGLPLIVTPNTGVEDFFTPGTPEGWMITASSTESLCDALIDAKSNRERTYSLGQAAARRAVYFSWEAYGDRVLKNYHSITGIAFPKQSLKAATAVDVNLL